MPLEDYFDFHAPNDIRVKGTRIGIEAILYEFIHRSQTPEAIASRYRSLTLEQVYATVTWYLHDRERGDAYLTEWLEHAERMRTKQRQQPGAVIERLKRLRAQREASEGVAEAQTP